MEVLVMDEVGREVTSMPARRKAASGRKTTGRQKRALRIISGTTEPSEGGRPRAKEIREKTPTSQKKRAAQRQWVAGRRKRKSGVADSAVREPKPSSAKTRAKKTSAKTKSKTRGASAAKASGSSQKPAVRKRAAAAAPTRARKQKTGGKQAATIGRRKNTPSRRSSKA